MFIYGMCEYDRPGAPHSPSGHIIITSKYAGSASVDAGQSPALQHGTGPGDPSDMHDLPPCNLLFQPPQQVMRPLPIQGKLCWGRGSGTP